MTAADAFAAMNGVKVGKLDHRRSEHGEVFRSEAARASSASAIPSIELPLGVNNREAIVRQLAANEIDIADHGQTAPTGNGVDPFRATIRC